MHAYLTLWIVSITITALNGCASQSQEGISEAGLPHEFITFLEEAEYVAVCKKRGMKLYVSETLDGTLLPGSIFAEYPDIGIPEFRIDPSEQWKDLVVYLPERNRLAYYRIDSHDQIDWFDAKDKRSRTVSVDDIREYYRK